ncbi:hypothetical protein JI666_20385 [Bacillus sp. NTK071]|uniref:hypothetical protein n=1 Tax=Bacillus sp. NTK071 TaxID=2802175 RepID=UPI001A8DC1A0|nr:hypothetical protein [Bacillus sp. NTK071]MBN8211097.1 hypothetical protein [Bacillus sp. NTK071]
MKKIKVIHDKTGFILGIYLEDREGKRMVYSCTNRKGLRPARIISAREKEGYEVEYVLEESGLIQLSLIEIYQLAN